MGHLGDKLAEFFYKELPPDEMAAARQHVDGCGDCRQQIAQFERTHLALKTAPDLDPPRRVVISTPYGRGWPAWFDWRQVVTAGATAALVAGLVVRLLGFSGLSPAPVPPVSVSVPATAPVIVQPEKVDYNRILSEVQQADRSWLGGELQKRDREIQRLRGELAYYENFERTVMRETLENGSAIQLLAQRTESRN